MKISQIPPDPRERIGVIRPSQWLKLPMTLTRRAFGAQTQKWTPLTPSCSIRWAPSFSKLRRCVPSPRRWRSKSVRTGPN